VANIPVLVLDRVRHFQRCIMSVCVLFDGRNKFTTACPAKLADPTKMPFGGPSNHVLDESAHRCYLTKYSGLISGGTGASCYHYCSNIGYGQVTRSFVIFTRTYMPWLFVCVSCLCCVQRQKLLLQACQGDYFKDSNPHLGDKR